jgi:hypothetical protein
MNRQFFQRSAALAALLGCVTLAASKDDDAAHRKADIGKHRAIAAAHEGAAKCLEAGKTEKVCHEELRNACKGLAIGKYCGMKHEH